MTRPVRVGECGPNETGYFAKVEVFKVGNKYLVRRCQLTPVEDADGLRYWVGPCKEWETEEKPDPCDLV